MKIESFIAKLQNFTQTSKAEFTAATIILFGLVGGLIVETSFRKNDIGISDNRAFLFLDSVAESEASTYIGTDIDGNVHEDIANADTIVSKPSLFPVHNKTKEIAVDEKININSASRVQLMRLPGIGEKTAQKIIEYRETSPFQNITDLQNVKGIGPKKFDKIKEKITTQ